jgi:uncharacterized Zn-binding protein involved in type VI secretion
MPGQGVCRIGDQSDHGGHLISTTQHFVKCNGQYVCVIPTTMHSCPIPGHGVTPIVNTPVHNCYIDGQKIVTIGSQAGCGAIMITGCANTNAQ